MGTHDMPWHVPRRVAEKKHNNVNTSRNEHAGNKKNTPGIHIIYQKVPALVSNINILVLRGVHKKRENGAKLTPKKAKTKKNRSVVIFGRANRETDGFLATFLLLGVSKSPLSASSRKNVGNFFFIFCAPLPDILRTTILPSTMYRQHRTRYEIFGTVSITRKMAR